MMRQKTYSNSDSISVSLITSTSKESPFCAREVLAAFSAMLARTFSRKESRYSCETSSSSSSFSELSAPCSDFDSNPDDEEREDVDEAEDVDDLEANPEDSSRSRDAANLNTEGAVVGPVFPFHLAPHF